MWGGKGVLKDKEEKGRGVEGEDKSRGVDESRESGVTAL